MPQVRFIKLEQRDKAQKICQLADQYFMQAKRLLLLVQDENQAVALDRFLWTWNKASFIPHAFDNGSVDCLQEPVVISTREKNPNNGSVLIMGAPCSPDFLSQFELVIDFAEAFDADLLEQSRARFRLYRELGLNPQML